MGEQRRKFTNDEILMCFEEAQRRPRGKIELNTTEIQTILNEDVLPGDVAVSRPSVKNRMPELVKDNKLERSKHGQSWHYRLPTDMERLFGPRGDIPKPPASETGGGPSLVERVAGYLGATALVGTVAAVAAGAGTVAAAIFPLLAVSLLATTTTLDTRLGARVDELRGELADMGGLSGFVRTALAHPVEEPETLVERAARADVYGVGALLAAVVVCLPVAAAVQLAGAETVVATLTPAGVLGFLALVSVLVSLAAVLIWLSVAATLALVSARAWLNTRDRDVPGGAP